ncbi:MAG: sigma-54-dependent Fis family transcriptional regulator, partial [bacterium]|nr:sigma-54-dependent Fis family transcriptional regulator [bacterium]
EAPPEVQVSLLRALEKGEIQPVGTQQPQTVDVRFIFATDADLEAAAAGGRFRFPLLQRLSSYKIILPPLRELREDFGRLFFHFLRDDMAAVGNADRLRDPGPDGSPWVPAELVARLALCDWPGNVRELGNIVRQLAVASRECSEMQIDSEIEFLLKEVEQGAGGNVVRTDEHAAGRRYRLPKEVSQEELLAALRANNWIVKQAARELNVSRTTIYALIDACPLVRKASDISREEIEQCAERCGGDIDAMAHQLEVSRPALLMRMKKLGMR